ncbi:MAG: YfhO family protein [Candidatus Eisenbacteria bacterium]
MAKRILPPLLLLAVVLIFFRGSLFQGRAEIPCNPNRWVPWKEHASPGEIAPPAVNTDCALAYYPRRAFTHEWMRRGDFPLWDPTTFAGQPFLANFQSALFYPVNLILALTTDAMTGMGWFVAIHFFLGGLFAYLAARAFGIGRGASVAAALVFELNPFFMTRIGHPTFVATAAWLPAVVLAAERAARRPGFRSTGVLALPLALAAFAGFPQMLLHIYYVLAFFSLAALISKERPRARTACTFGAAIALSLLLAAAQLLPTLEFLRLSTREAADLATFRSGTHHPLMALRILAPDFFGNPVNETLWSTLFRTGNGMFRQNYVSTLNYFGALPLVIGLYGIFTGRRRLFFAGLFLFPLLVLAGTPLADIAWRLPGFRFSRPDRLILLPLFATAIGFGFGVDRLSDRARKTPPFVLAGFVVLLAGAAALALFREPIIEGLLRGRAPVTNGVVLLLKARVPLANLSATALRSSATTALFAAAGLLLVLVRRRIPSAGIVALLALLAGADLYLFGARFHLDLPRDSTFRETPEILRIREDVGPDGRIARYGPAATDFLPPATASLFGIDDTAGINALNLERYRKLMETIEPGLYSYRRYRPLQRLESLKSPALRILGARVYGVDDSGGILPMPGPRPLPRATFHGRWEYLSGAAILLRLRSPEFDPAETLLLEGQGPPAPVAPRGGSADIQRYEPDRVTVGVVARSPGFLFLADAWYPGWEATVDGGPATLYRADYAFRAVPVPEGEHVIDFRYRPRSLRFGAALSSAALLVMILLAAAPRRRRTE